MSEGNWEELKFDNDYEIYSEFPHPIRRKGKDKIVTESITHGYTRLHINNKQVFKHRLIALQWIVNDNPDTNNEIDHINRNKSDNRIENLRWISRSGNCKNMTTHQKRKHEYLEELPENAVQVCDYNEIKLDRYYFDIDTDRLLLETRTKTVKYKIIKPYLLNNQLVINLYDENGKNYIRNYIKIINHLNNIL